MSETLLNILITLFVIGLLLQPLLGMRFKNIGAEWTNAQMEITDGKFGCVMSCVYIFVWAIVGIIVAFIRNNSGARDNKDYFILATNIHILALVVGNFIVYNDVIRLHIGIAKAKAKASEKKRIEDQQKIQREVADRERQKQQEIANSKVQKDQQKQFYTSLIDLGTGSFALFETMPSHLLTAEELLDQAEIDFQESAFAPFWDSVERAATKLGDFDIGVRTITANANRYTDVAKRYEGSPPPFPIILDSVTGMAAASTTNERMKAIVRTAQRNFQFATIFEQRKTNQLLVAGFTNLAQALDGMGRRIEASLDDLGGQISEMSSTIDTSLQNLGSNITSTLTGLHRSSMEVSERMVDKFDGLNVSFQKESADRVERHKQALEMLNNIQRRRRPRPEGLRDGEY